MLAPANHENNTCFVLCNHVNHSCFCDCGITDTPAVTDERRTTHKTGLIVPKTTKTTATTSSGKAGTQPSLVRPAIPVAAKRMLPSYTKPPKAASTSMESKSATMYTVGGGKLINNRPYMSSVNQSEVIWIKKQNT